MTRFFAIASMLLVAFSIVLSQNASAAEEAKHIVVIKAGQLFDSTGDNYQRNVAVVVEGERIKSIGPSADVAIPDGAEVIDLSSATILPGLIDCHIHTAFQLDNRIGLGDVLKQPAPDGKLPVHKISPTLWVMTAGRANRDPMSGLVSDTMKQFLAEAAEQFDWIVLDTPPVALLTDANLLAAMIDTAVLVVNAKTTPYPLAMRAVESIGASRILGVVLNRAERSEVAAGYSYYEYSYRTRANPRTRRWHRFRLAFTRRT